MNKKKEPEEMVAFNVRILPRKLRNQFKAKCVTANRPMEEVLVGLMKKVASGKIKVEDV
jgi:hypothetical protein